jgi:arylsulfatase A-like enzyme
MLRDNGYATGMFGKWHNTPEPDISPAGPFDRWPTGLGFDYFYGFNQGETHQYYPTIYRNTTWVPQPKTPDQGYHFTADMTDEAIAWTRNIRAANLDKPWFNYFSTSGVHAPHHATKEWRDKFAGKFDYGWDKQRELTHAKQLEMGIIPKGTKLTPRSKDVPAWADQKPEAKKVYARLMENYAAYMAYTDHEVGRLIDSLQESGELDNTLVMYVVGDNGASAEGGLEGTFSEVASLLGVQLGLNSTAKRIDEIGDDFFWRAVRHFFNVHAAFAGGNEGHLLRGAVGYHRQVILFLDIGAVFDVQAPHLLAQRAGLVRLELHAQDVAGARLDLVDRLGHLHAAALAAAARMDLRLDHPHRATELLCRLDGLLHRESRNAARDRHAKLAQDFLGLVFVNFHERTLDR